MITHDRGSAVVAPPYGGDEARIVEERPADAIVTQSAAVRALIAASRQAKGGGHGPPPFDISAKLRS
jgi:hypothetical protein